MTNMVIERESGEESDDAEGGITVGKKGKDRSVTQVLEVDEFGLPQVPVTTGLSLPVKKDVFRSLVTMSYRELE
jgi:hypothetical protein